MDELVSSITTALQVRSTLPPFPDSLTVEEAYEVQLRVIDRIGVDSVNGIKAGLTSARSQEVFGLTHPVLGHLLAPGEVLSGASIQSFDGGKIECEIGVNVDRSGTPVSIVPVIELPRFAFNHEHDATGPNLIACNVAADRYIVGQTVDLQESFSDCSVVLSRNGEMLFRANLTEPLGGPMKSLTWMLDEAKARHIHLPSSALMLTGACGGIHPALPGSYVADYGELGKVEFEILPT